MPSASTTTSTAPIATLHGDTLLHAFLRTRQGPTHRHRATVLTTAFCHDSFDKCGVVSLSYLSRLQHIGHGADYCGLPVHLLVANKNVRVIREDGSLIRELVLAPTRDYQPLWTKPGPKPRVLAYVVRHMSTMS